MPAVLRRVVASVVAWVVGAAAVAGVVLFALSMVGGGLTGSAPQPLAGDSIEEQIDTSPTQPSPTAGVPSQPPPSAAGTRRPTTERSSGPSRPEGGAQRSFTSPGGTAVAGCVGTDRHDAYLVSWSPAQDYRVVEVERGPDSTAKVLFRDGDRSVLVTVRCDDGEPRATVREEP